MSAVCPNCGSTESRRRGDILSTSRVCCVCFTRYKIPTPLWERLLFATVFIVPGLLLGAVGVGFLVLMTEHSENNTGIPLKGIGLSVFLGILGLICIVKGILELGGSEKRTGMEREFDSIDEVEEVSTQEFMPGTAPVVPKKKAESLVREIAQEHGAKGILRKLGNLREDHLANATANYAEAMRDDETPLALIDISPIGGNGKVGFLLTNRGLYSSFSSPPIWLADIEEVAIATPGFQDYLTCYLLGPIFYHLIYGSRLLQHRLLVNGKLIYASGHRLRGDFWIELLTALAAAAREVQPLSTQGSSAHTAPSVVVLETMLSHGDGASNETRQVRDPPWQQIEQSIHALDGDRYPSLRIWAGEVEQAPALDILGGNGKYVLRELGDGWIYYDPNGGEEEVEVCVSGAGYRCPAFYVCTDLDRVLEIARHFVLTGTPE